MSKMENLTAEAVQVLADKIATTAGIKIPHGSTAAYILTFTAVKEVAMLIVPSLVASAKWDLTGFQLTKVQVAIKELDRKVNKILTEPEKSAKDFLDTAFGMVGMGLYAEAYKKFDLCHELATRGFHLAESLQVCGMASSAHELNFKNKVFTGQNSLQDLQDPQLPLHHAIQR
ncbi:MAG: hypothetical protein AAF354_14185 [Pseudomonadota bacterium]